MTAGPRHRSGGPAGGAGTAEDFGRAGPATAAVDARRDSEVVALREQGRSFASIARALGLEGAVQANAAFMEALRRLPTAEQESLRSHEMARLNALGERLRQRSDLDEAEMARRARALDRLRKRLSA
ncbi:MAG TPA: hypothetical protein VK425_07200 [Acidimicrobiales bacterium]|nr:hypothetical protein [Acidimicrobiales bacterium]